MWITVTRDNDEVHCLRLLRMRPGIRERVQRVSLAGYSNRPVPWDVWFDYADNGLSWRPFSKRPGDRRRNRRQEMLQHNAGQINAVSEMVLYLLRNGIPVHPLTMTKLQRYKTTLSEVGKRRNSVKKRREFLQEQKGSGFWQGLNDVFQACRH